VNGPVHARAEELLEVVANELDDIDRSYIAPGTPAYDCPNQLTVHVTIMETVMNRCAARLRATYTITLLRCCAVLDEDGEPPEPEEMAADAVVVLAEAWHVWSVVAGAACSRSLFDGRDCDDVLVGTMTLIEPQGGVVGWTLDVTVDV